jgi:hypothetical protein
MASVHDLCAPGVEGGRPGAPHPMARRPAMGGRRGSRQREHELAPIGTQARGGI